MANKYNIFWIDDEHEALKAFKFQAKDNNIILFPFKSLNSGMADLKKNFHKYDGILLDAKIFKNDSDAAGSEDTDFIHRAKEEILQLPKKFDIFVLTGQAEAYNDNTFGKAFKRVYEKGTETETERLFTDLKEAAEEQPDTQIRHKHQRVFEICTEEYLGDDSAITLLNALKNAKKETTGDSKDYFLNLRKLLELLFTKLNAIGLIPDEIFKSNGWFNPSSDFLTGKPSTLTIKSKIIHPTISFLLRQLKDVTQDAEHSISERLRLKTEDFILSNKTPYLYRSALNQICDVLIWFKTFIDEHPSIEENKSFTTASQNVDADCDWIIGEIYEITYNGWGKFISECGEIDLSIPKFMMEKNSLQISSQIKIQTKPENNKHITEIRQL